MASAAPVLQPAPHLRTRRARPTQGWVELPWDGDVARLSGKLADLISVTPDAMAVVATPQRHDVDGRTIKCASHAASQLGGIAAVVRRKGRGRLIPISTESVGSARLARVVAERVDPGRYQWAGIAVAPARTLLEGLSEISPETGPAGDLLELLAPSCRLWLVPDPPG